jgi:hypothetical protein
MGETLDTPRPAASLKGGIGWVAAAVRHAGWWLDWQTRNRAGQGCHAVKAAREPQPARQRAA